MGRILTKYEGGAQHSNIMITIFYTLSEKESNVICLIY